MSTLDVVQAGSIQATFNILIYGESGIGKTVLACSSDEVAGPTLLVDIEGGALSVGQFYPNVDVIRVKKSNQIEDIYDTLASSRDELNSYNTVVIDSLSELRQMLVRESIDAGVREDAGKDPDVAAIRDYLRALEKLRRVVRAFRDLDINTVFTALVNHDKDERTGKRTVMPALGDTAGREVPGYVDIVGYMYTKIQNDKPHRMLLTKHVGREIAKDRTGKLPEVIQEPTMSKILTDI